MFGVPSIEASENRPGAPCEAHSSFFCKKKSLDVSIDENGVLLQLKQSLPRATNPTTLVRKTEERKNAK